MKKLAIATAASIACVAFFGVCPSAEAQIWDAGSTPTGDAEKAEHPHLSKREARYHHDRAVALADAARIDEAVAEDRIAIAMNPDHPGYQILMARLLIDQGKLQSALATYEEVCRRWPDMRKDIGELISSLKMSIAFIKVDNQLSHANTSTTATPSELSHVADVRSVPEGSQKSQDAYKPPRQSGTFLRRFLSDAPIYDPVY